MNQSQYKQPSRSSAAQSNGGKMILMWSKLISVFLILGTFAFFFVYCVFLPRTTSSVTDTLIEFPEFSFKELIDGTYTTKLGAYFTDTVHNRDYIRTDLYKDFVGLFGEEHVVLTEDGEKQELIGTFSDPTEGDQPDIDWSTDEDPGIDISWETPGEDVSGTVSSDGSTPPQEESPDNNSSTAPELEEPEIQANSILLIGTRAMEIYYGDPNLKTLPVFAQTLNTFASNNPELNVYSMMIPKAAAFYLNKSKDFGHLAGRTLNDQNNLDELLSSDVQSINIYDILNSHKDEAIYMRTDHHWGALGAYYAAKQFASDLGLPFQDLSTYTKNVRKNYLGTMYTYSGKHTTLRDNPEDFVTYEPNATYKYYTYDQKFENPKERTNILHYVSEDAVSSWYLTFIGGDSYSVKIQSDVCKNGRKLLIVKDSYGNALVPYLLYSFEEIYVVDARKFEIHLDTFTEQQGITDVLFAECAFSAVGKDYIMKLKGLVE